MTNNNFWWYIKQIMNVFHSCDVTYIFIRWKMNCSIQLGFDSLNRIFHLSHHENICTIALITIHYLYKTWAHLRFVRRLCHTTVCLPAYTPVCFPAYTNVWIHVRLVKCTFLYVNNMPRYVLISKNYKDVHISKNTVVICRNWKKIAKSSSYTSKNTPVWLRLYNEGNTWVHWH